MGFVFSLFLGEKPLRKSNLEGAHGHGAPAPADEVAIASEHSPAVAAEHAVIPPTAPIPVAEHEDKRVLEPVGD